MIKFLDICISGTTLIHIQHSVYVQTVFVNALDSHNSHSLLIFILFLHKVVSCTTQIIVIHDSNAKIMLNSMNCKQQAIMW